MVFSDSAEVTQPALIGPAQQPDQHCARKEAVRILVRTLFLFFLNPSGLALLRLPSHSMERNRGLGSAPLFQELNGG